MDDPTSGATQIFPEASTATPFETGAELLPKPVDGEIAAPVLASSVMKVPGAIKSFATQTLSELSMARSTGPTIPPSRYPVAGDNSVPEGENFVILPC